MITEVVKPSEIHKVDPVFGQLSFDNHEQIVFCNDKDTGLKAIIGTIIQYWVRHWAVLVCGHITMNGRH